MKNGFVPYDFALRMKHIDFDGFTLFHINRNNVLNSISESPTSMFQYNMEPNEDDTDSLVAAPTFSQAFRWFREKHKFFHEVFIDCLPKADIPIEEDLMFSFTIHLVIEDKLICGPREVYRTYEEAELACLEKLIEIVESQNK